MTLNIIFIYIILYIFYHSNKKMKTFIMNDIDIRAIKYKYYYIIILNNNFLNGLGIIKQGKKIK